MLDTIDDYKNLLRALLEEDGNVQREAMRILCRTDLYFLLWYVCGRRDMERQWLLDRCKEVQENPDGYIDLWARNHYKSTVITFAKTIQDILINPEITIGIFAHTRPIAKGFLRQIKREFETNVILKELFPDVLYEELKDAPTWSEDTGIVVKRQGNPKEATIEAWGLVDGQPTSKHFRLRIYDDVVTRESVTTAEQVHKTTEAWELSDNLGMEGGVVRVIGTRYCTIGNTRILMSDWSHKKIKDIKVGEEIVGWSIKKFNKRFLTRAKVIACGVHRQQQVNTYTFSNGRTVTCTPDHLWWRGAHWASQGENFKNKNGEKLSRGREYSPIGFGYHQMRSIRQLLVPTEKNNSWEAGWLAGFFDGEGTIKKNKNHPSGLASFTQSEKNRVVIEKFFEVMGNLGFDYSINVCDEGLGKNSRCYHFNMNGGWSARYKFVASIQPSRVKPLAETLFGQLHTDKLDLVSIEAAGLQDVYWLETETGNYVAEGFCSKNSMFDTYSIILERGAAKARIYPATHNGRMDGIPVLMSQKEWELKLKTQSRPTIASQLLQNPLADEDATFRVEWLRPYEVRPKTLNVYIMCDPSKGRNAQSDNTAIAVVGLASGGTYYFLDGLCHRMTLSQRWVALRDLYKKWSREPGVMSIKVGYERYGAQSDDEYFQERMLLENKNLPQEEKFEFQIHELNWTFEGTKGEQGKTTRVERLEPKFRNSRFFLPLAVWRGGKPMVWRIEDDPDSKNYRGIVWEDVRGWTKAQKAAIDGGSMSLVAKAIKQIDEERHVYDVTLKFIEEYMYFPFGRYKDLIDATSRIDDMEPVIPQFISREATEPRVYFDS